MATASQKMMLRSGARLGACACAVEAGGGQAGAGSYRGSAPDKVLGRDARSLHGGAKQ